MTNEELKQSISSICPSAVYEDGSEFLNVVISNDELLSLMPALKQKPEFNFDYLFCLTCVDWKDHFMMVYHLNSTTLKHSLVVKAKISDIVNPKIESVNSLWKAAELLEDEVYDMFGVKFSNHPNLRRIFLGEEWNGFPLRKNYVDENMIKL